MTTTTRMQAGLETEAFLAAKTDQAVEILREKGIDGLRGYCKSDGILYEVKYLLPAHAVDGRL